MTGRAAGYCAGNAQPGFANSAGGFGFGRRGRAGGGGGRGWRHWYYATGLTGGQRAAQAEAGVQVPAVEPVSAPAPAPTVRDKEVAALKSQMKSLNETLEAINQRLAQLENPVE